VGRKEKKKLTKKKARSKRSGKRADKRGRKIIDNKLRSQQTEEKRRYRRGEIKREAA